MTHPSLPRFLRSAAFRRSRGGVFAVLFCEEDWMVAETLAHLRRLRPAHILAIGRTGGLADDTDLSTIQADLGDRRARSEILNTLIPELEGRWIAWQSNGEFLFYPWSETRTLGDLAQFLADERRRILFTYALDLYAQYLPEAAELATSELFFDRIAYHAFPSEDRALAVFGGLGWRFEEFLPERMQQIGRPTLFRATKGLRIQPDLTFAEPDHRSVSAPWHHSPTGAMMSLRRTKRLLLAPGFVDVADRLIWHGSERFAWSSAQLLDLGFIEPGQWF
ncbi:MAG: hypothetical protein AAFR17_14115 [Pseudomonadota bacterium]